MPPPMMATSTLMAIVSLSTTSRPRRPRCHRDTSAGTGVTPRLVPEGVRDAIPGGAARPSECPWASGTGRVDPPDPLDSTEAARQGRRRGSARPGPSPPRPPAHGPDALPARHGTGGPPPAGTARRSSPAPTARRRRRRRGDGYRRRCPTPSAGGRLRPDDGPAPWSVSHPSYRGDQQRPWRASREVEHRPGQGGQPHGGRDQHDQSATGGAGVRAPIVARTVRLPRGPRIGLSELFPHCWDLPYVLPKSAYFAQP